MKSLTLSAAALALLITSCSKSPEVQAPAAVTGKGRDCVGATGGHDRRRPRLRPGEVKQPAGVPVLDRGLVPAVQSGQEHDFHATGLHREVAFLRAGVRRMAIRRADRHWASASASAAIRRWCCCGRTAARSLAWPARSNLPSTCRCSTTESPAARPHARRWLPRCPESRSALRTGACWPSTRGKPMSSRWCQRRKFRRR